MMRGTVRIILVASFLVLTFSLYASAQFLVIDSSTVLDRLGSHEKVLLVDVRSTEEYRQGHIPGAISIPAERMFDEKRRLPKDKQSQIIFYCRGAG